MNLSGLPAGYVPIAPRRIEGYPSPPLVWRPAGVPSAALTPGDGGSAAIGVLVGIIAAAGALYALRNLEDDTARENPTGHPGHFPGRLGSGSRFAACEREVEASYAKRGKPVDAGAVCASIGRHAYGAKKFASFSHPRGNPSDTHRLALAQKHVQNLGFSSEVVLDRSGKELQFRIIDNEGFYHPLSPIGTEREIDDWREKGLDKRPAGK